MAAPTHACPICGQETPLSWCGGCDIVDAMDEEAYEKAVQIIYNTLPDQAFAEINLAKGINFLEWHVPFHHGWGTKIRGLLRSNGITDDITPTGNLDDVYAFMIESAWRAWRVDRAAKETKFLLTETLAERYLKKQFLEYEEEANGNRN